MRVCVSGPPAASTGFLRGEGGKGAGWRGSVASLTPSHTGVSRTWLDSKQKPRQPTAGEREKVFVVIVTEKIGELIKKQ